MVSGAERVQREAVMRENIFKQRPRVVRQGQHLVGKLLVGTRHDVGLFDVVIAEFDNALPILDAIGELHDFVGMHILHR